MTLAKIGYGATVSMTLGGTATVLAEVIEIGLPNPQVDDVEATHFKSPDRTKEYIAGLIENGEISLAINWVPGSTDDLAISTAQKAGEAVETVISVPTASTDQTFTFDAIIKGYEKTIPIDDRMTAALTLRVAGAVTQAAAA